MAQKLFEFVIMRHYKPTKAEEEKGMKPTSSILVAPKHILAADENKALLIAAREIPAEFLDGKLDELELLIRPF